MQVISYTDARNSLKTVLDGVVDNADYTLITRRDADNAIVMSQDYFDSLMETVHLLSSPVNAAHLNASMEQYRSGKTLEKGLLDVD
jgi:antitoxin YefM